MNINLKELVLLANPPDDSSNNLLVVLLFLISLSHHFGILSLSVLLCSFSSLLQP